MTHCGRYPEYCNCGKSIGAECDLPEDKYTRKPKAESIVVWDGLEDSRGKYVAGIDPIAYDGIDDSAKRIAFMNARSSPTRVGIMEEVKFSRKGFYDYMTESIRKDYFEKTSVGEVRMGKIEGMRAVPFIFDELDPNNPAVRARFREYDYLFKKHRMQGLSAARTFFLGTSGCKNNFNKRELIVARKAKIMFRNKQRKIKLSSRLK